MMSDKACPLGVPDLGGIERVELRPVPMPVNFDQALALARGESEKRFDEFTLVSWYDRARDFESPPHATEAACGPKNGYILYAVSHGAKLLVDVGRGSFVFFYAPVEW